MKKLSFLAILLFAIVFSSCGQKKEVPQNVKSAFEKKFTNASSVKWDQEKTGEWEAEFKMNGKEYSANFDEQGKWLETEYEIKETQIPAAVKNTISKDFAGYKLKESEISETAKGKAYEFELVKDKEKVEVAIAEDGKIIKQEKASTEGKDKEDKD